MKLLRPVAGLAMAVAASLAFTGAATAAFPNFSGCPASTPGVEICVDVQNTSGNLNIKGFNVPLHESLEIRGGLIFNETPTPIFVPATGTNGFIGKPVPVPGGLLGIEWIPGNSVLAITELVGPPSGIRINVPREELTVPVRVRLENILLGMNCQIGTSREPVTLRLTTGTTSPPAPNTPISGRYVPPQLVGSALIATGVVDVENSFAVPGAAYCGLGLGLINSLVNAKLGLPSAAGNNSIAITNNVALGELPG